MTQYIIVMNFKQYIKILEQNTVGTHNDFATGALLPSDWTGSETPDINLPFLSSTDLSIPEVSRSSTISNIIKNKNPILIELKDGTKLYLTLEQYKRINKVPEVGKRLTVVFQRNSSDQSEQPSKVIKIEID
jgi:hypothetical protein